MNVANIAQIPLKQQQMQRPALLANRFSLLPSRRLFQNRRLTQLPTKFF